MRRWPRAGFYAVEAGKISFRRDGNWYSDDERIDNPRIALLFSRSIRRNPDGSYFLQVAEERAPITVEDTPYVVKAIDGDARSGFTLVLNDEQRIPLDPAALEVGGQNVLYARVKDGALRARFLRSAYYHLSDCIEGDERAGFSLRIGGKRYPLGTAAPAWPIAAARPELAACSRSRRLHVVLVRPEIPQNTGSIARLVAATRTRLHLVGPLGFSLEDRYLKRAGLDYWPLVDLRTYPGWDEFAAATPAGVVQIFLHARRQVIPRRALRARRHAGVRRRDQGAGRGLPARSDGVLVPDSDLRARRAQSESLQRGVDRGVRGAAPDGFVGVETERPADCRPDPHPCPDSF